MNKRLVKQARRLMKKNIYRKSKARGRNFTGYNDHIVIKDNEQFIKLYGKDYKLDYETYRIVDKFWNYKNHYTYKVYNKVKCYYEIFSPFFNTFIPEQELL